MNPWRAPRKLFSVYSAAGHAMLAVVAGICGSTANAEVSSELDDAAARMQYAFYTDDTRGLEELLTLVSGLAASAPGMNEYYLAYGNWKLAQLYAAKGTAGKAASKARQECSRQAEAAIALDKRLAEAYALDAICSGSSGPILLGAGCARSKSLRTALELDPQNPRVRLIELMCAEQDAPDMATRLQQLRAVVDMFEATPARPGKPDWGQAEALVLLGQYYLQRGDSLAARDTIERALVVAPDYRKAQELLQAAAARPK